MNGEAIYGTRPWYICEEGPTKTRENDYYMNESTGQDYVQEDSIGTFTGQDVRYTCKGNDVYAIVLGIPEHGSILLNALAGIRDSIDNIRMAGSTEDIKWEKEEDGIRICFPQNLPCEHAYVFKVKRLIRHN